MISTTTELEDALARMALTGGDDLSLEAKVFSEFSSNSIGPTLSAFANLPGGGTILLGVDERQDNMVIGVDDPHDLAQRVTNLARTGLSTQISVDSHTITLGDKTVVVINVAESPINDKPVSYQRKAYVRQYDGDYVMSLQEQQQFLRRHERPRDDRVPVSGTGVSDLNPEAVRSFVASIRMTTPALAQASDEEILRRLNVIAESGEATVGGLYALGIYPQQYLPHLSLTAAVLDPGGGEKNRARNRMDFTGPIPDILDRTLDWVTQNMGHTLVVTQDGRGVDEYDFPLVAVREIVANALVHRDLSDAASGRVVELRLTPDGLVLTNPGGLWGLSVDQLGTPDGKSAVNEFLYGMCRHVTGKHGRIIEAMGTGIAATRQALAEAGLEPPQFFDNTIRFTVRFPNHALYSNDELLWLGKLPLAEINSRQKEALLRLRSGEWIANGDYRQMTGVNSETARSELQHLIDLGLVERSGERRGTRYRIAAKFR